MVWSDPKAIEDITYGVFEMLKYDIEYVDMKLGIAHLTVSHRDKKPLAVIYAEGKNLDHMNATIDLLATAVDLLNQRLAEIREHGIEPAPEPDENPLAWYHRELEKGTADRITLRD